jgi:hypothetical protein
MHLSWRRSPVGSNLSIFYHSFDLSQGCDCVRQCRPSQVGSAEDFISQAHHAAPPPALLIRAWLGLAAETDDIEEKHRCLEEVLEPNPEHQAARAGLVLLHQPQASDSEMTWIAKDGCRC